MGEKKEVERAGSLRFKLIDFAIATLSRMPMWMLYAMMAPVRGVMRRVVKYRRKVIRKNLRLSFPEKSEAELLEIEKKFYRHLFDIIAETVKLRTISDKELSRRMVVTNPEVADDILRSGTPVVLLLGHTGNWEFVPHLVRSVSADVPFGEIYKGLHDEDWGAEMFRIRSRWEGVTQIRQDEALRKIVGWNRQGPWIVGFISDQHPNVRPFLHWLTFMNQEAAVVVGGEKIGSHMKARFLYADIEKTSRGHYALTYREVVADPASESDYPVTEAYIRMLETTIRRDPAIWLWSHNRWKYNKEKELSR